MNIVIHLHMVKYGYKYNNAEGLNCCHEEITNRNPGIQLYNDVDCDIKAN